MASSKDRKGLWNRLTCNDGFQLPANVMTGLMSFKCPEAAKDQFKRK